MTKLLPNGQKKKSEGGASQHWCTPGLPILLAHRVFRGGLNLDGVDLDPFSNPNSRTAARIQWYGPDVDGNDGFELSWAAVAETVLYNPPWKRSGDAVRKAAAEWEDGCASIGIVPCSMNSQHWPIVERAAARCYPHRRVSFLEDGVPKKGNPKDVVLIYEGPEPYWFAHHLAEYGRIHFGRVQ